MNNQLVIRIGKKIREIRNHRQIKLHELAEESHISKGLLSRIENGRTIPSLPVLLSIVGSLKINLDVFFEGLEIAEQKPYILRRKSEYVPFEKEEGFGFMYQSILTCSIPSVAIEAVILDLQPGSQREAVITDGYEFKYLLKGEIEYHLGEEVVVMHTGDSLFFNGKIPHLPVNHTNEPASLLVIYLLLPSGGT